ncbi:hypothetical protein LQF76_07030 [Gloeomargaritales cyanobacterium VI4D9]|nr:hypothetical protein LQF76_07030 [Gloeomargaritales cyanobacterium VI4D9]
MKTTAERTTLMAALGCLDIDIEQELRRLQTERHHWQPEFWQSLLASHPTPPPETAWTFPPAASADAPLEPTEAVMPPSEVAPELAATVAMTKLPEQPEALDATVAFVPPADPPPDALALLDVGEDEITDEVAHLLAEVAPEAVPEEQIQPEGVPPRPSWSERLHRVLARRPGLASARTLAVPPEAVGDPWLETFSEPHQQPLSQGGMRPSVLGFALGVTTATLGTLGILFLFNREQPRPAHSPQLTVPAPPPEQAVVASPKSSPLAPVPNLTRKELPDVSAIPTASPKASPAVSPSPGFYYVVTDYRNEQSLTEAQKVVPEAFVWQFSDGVKIQLAAFEARDQAEQFVADLKAKGMTARVYP